MQMDTKQQSKLYDISQFCPSTSSSPSITCYDSCCCYDNSYNSNYCCECSIYSTFVILFIIFLFLFIILLIVGIRKFIINRRNLRQNLSAYRLFNNQPIYQPNNYPNNPPNTYPHNSLIHNHYQIHYQQANPNQPYHAQNYQQPNKYFQQNKESIYMGQPVNQSDDSLKNQRIYVH